MEEGPIISEINKKQRDAHTQTRKKECKETACLENVRSYTYTLGGGGAKGRGFTGEISVDLGVRSRVQFF